MSDAFFENLNIQRDEKEDRRSRERVDKGIFYILVATIILIPLLVGGHVTQVISPLITDKEVLNSGIKGDIFTFYKFVVLLVLTISALGLFLYKLFFLDYRLPKRKVLWFFAIFLISIVVSTMLSTSKTIALYGQYNRSDGAISYICYVLLMFIAMHIEYPKKAVEYVLYAFYPLVIINFIIITMNFTGHDILIYEPVQKAISMFLPKGAKLGTGSQMLGTLNHFNYMSGTFAIITVMYLSWSVIDKSIIRRNVNLIVALLSVATMLMAESTSGFLTVLVVIPFIIWLIIKSENRKMAFMSLIVFCFLSVVILHMLALKNPKVWDESVGFFISKNPYTVQQPLKTSFKDDGLNPLLQFETPVAAAKKTYSLPVLPKSGVGAGSGRVFIWKHAIKKTMERPLFGYGLDTLMYNFPQYSIDLRANLETGTVVVDKPHNLYIGILYGTGIVGFIGFFGLIALTLWTAFKIIFCFNSSSSLAVTLCVAWLAYLFQALFNDSLPGSTTPLWICAGMMMALFNKQKYKAESK